VQVNNYTLVDGSILSTLDLGGAVSACREAKYQDANIILDIILTNSAAASVA